MSQEFAEPGNGANMELKSFMSNFNEAFSEGLKRINTGGRSTHFGSFEAGKWGFMDTLERVMIPLKFDDAKPFTSGRAAVRSMSLRPSAMRDSSSSSTRICRVTIFAMRASFTDGRR